MIELVAPAWEGYELLDSGEGERLERFGSYLLVRPDPNVLWPKGDPAQPAWRQPDARFVGKGEEGGWQLRPGLPASWEIAYGKARFRVKPTPFRHVGLFPEQSVQWQWLVERVEAAVRRGTRPRVLNLFAYTGAASVLAALAGAEVCHVDASAGSLNWAKENVALSGLAADAIRWIVDDVPKFVGREVRRGRRYDLILLDPPVFGRGPKGEIWRLEKGIASLAANLLCLLSDQPLGLLANLYATAIYPQAIARLFPAELELELGSLLLRDPHSKIGLPTGFFLRSRM